AEWFSTPTDKHQMAYKGFVAFGLEHLAKAKLELSHIDKAKHYSFLSLVHAEQTLKLADKKQFSKQDTIYISPLVRQWVLFKASLFGI
ncbi:MAG: hypothetical protein AB8B49_03240, partial [Nitratireductor sp.]